MLICLQLYWPRELIDRTIKRTSATNCARIYNTSFTNESIQGSVPAVWHVSLEMDVDHVWDGFYIYSLLLDHAERDAVLYLDHNAPSQAKRIRPALQACNHRMRGTGQEEWSHACELCAWAYVYEHGVKRMFYFPQFNVLLTLAQGPFVPWSLMVLTWAVHVVVIMIAITLWSLYEINFAPNTASITMNVR